MPQHLNADAAYGEDGIYYERIPHQVMPFVDSWNHEYNNQQRVNSDGLFDRDYNITDPSQKRIVVVGDSFIQSGYLAYEKSHHYLLESELKKNDTLYEVINGGHGGTGTAQHHDYLANKLLQYKPVAVILYFYYNDIDDNYLRNNWILQNGSLVKKDPVKKSAFLNFRIFLSQHSHVYSFIYYTVLSNPAIKNLFAKNKIINDQTYYSNLSENIVVQGLLSNSSPQYEDALTETRVLLSRVKKLTDDNNVSLGIVYIPSVYQLVDNRTQKLTAGYNLSVSDYDLFKVNHELLNITGDLSIPLYDMTPILLSHSPEKLFYSIDIHWNEQGQAIAAGDVASFILDNVTCLTCH